MEGQTLPVLVTAILTILSPILTAIFTKVSMSSTTKNNIALVVSFVIAGVYTVMTSGVTDWSDLGTLVGVLPVVYTMQQVIFNNLLKSVSTKVEEKVGVKEHPPAEVQLEETPAKG